MRVKRHIPRKYIGRIWRNAQAKEAIEAFLRLPQRTQQRILRKIVAQKIGIPVKKLGKLTITPHQKLNLIKVSIEGKRPKKITALHGMLQIPEIREKPLHVIIYWKKMEGEEIEKTQVHEEGHHLVSIMRGIPVLRTRKRLRQQYLHDELIAYFNVWMHFGNNSMKEFNRIMRTYIGQVMYEITSVEKDIEGMNKERFNSLLKELTDEFRKIFEAIKRALEEMPKEQVFEIILKTGWSRIPRELKKAVQERK